MFLEATAVLWRRRISERVQQRAETGRGGRGKAQVADEASRLEIVLRCLALVSKPAEGVDDDSSDDGEQHIDEEPLEQASAPPLLPPSLSFLPPPLSLSLLLSPSLSSLLTPSLFLSPSFPPPSLSLLFLLLYLIDQVPQKPDEEIGGIRDRIDDVGRKRRASGHIPHSISAHGDEDVGEEALEHVDADVVALPVLMDVFEREHTDHHPDVHEDKPDHECVQHFKGLELHRIHDMGGARGEQDWYLEESEGGEKRSVGDNSRECKEKEQDFVDEGPRGEDDPGDVEGPLAHLPPPPLLLRLLVCIIHSIVSTRVLLARVSLLLVSIIVTVTVIVRARCRKLHPALLLLLLRCRLCVLAFDHNHRHMRDAERQEPDRAEDQINDAHVPGCIFDLGQDFEVEVLIVVRCNLHIAGDVLKDLKRGEPGHDVVRRVASQDHDSMEQEDPDVGHPTDQVPLVDGERKGCLPQVGVKLLLGNDLTYVLQESLRPSLYTLVRQLEENDLQAPGPLDLDVSRPLLEEPGGDWSGVQGFLDGSCPVILPHKLEHEVVDQALPHNVLLLHPRLVLPHLVAEPHLRHHGSPRHRRDHPLGDDVPLHALQQRVDAGDDRDLEPRPHLILLRLSHRIREHAVHARGPPLEDGRVLFHLLEPDLVEDPVAEVEEVGGRYRLLVVVVRTMHGVGEHQKAADRCLSEDEVSFLDSALELLP
eukprot:760125-Hanusia_phi.AAC.1